MPWGYAIMAVGSIVAADKQADATEEAARIQTGSGDEGIQFARETRDLIRSDLAPFRAAGEAQLTPLTALISDPTAQLNFVQGNPFFKALSDDAQSRIFNNQAAKGKVGSGETAKALQNSLLLLGQGLLNNNIDQRMRLVNTGQAAAAGQAAGSLSTGSSILDLITGKGNAAAAGVMGRANAQSQGIGDLFKIGGSLFGGSGSSSSGGSTGGSGGIMDMGGYSVNI